MQLFCGGCGALGGRNASFPCNILVMILELTVQQRVMLISVISALSLVQKFSTFFSVCRYLSVFC